MNEMYYVVHNSDGDTTIEQMTKEELAQRINDKYWGEGVVFFDGFPAEPDTNYWGRKVLIIKGALVHPKPIKVVTEYQL